MRNVTVKKIEEIVDKSLRLYSDKDFLNSFTVDEATLTVMDENVIIELYQQAVNTWLYYQSQLINLEEFELCAKIKTLLELEFNDTVSMLFELKVEHPENTLLKIKGFYECLYLNKSLTLETETI